MALPGISRSADLWGLQSRRAVAFCGLAPEGILLDFWVFPKPSGGGGTLASGISSPLLLHPVVRPRQIDANRAQRRAMTARGGFMGEDLARDSRGGLWRVQAVGKEGGRCGDPE